MSFGREGESMYERGGDCSTAYVQPEVNPTDVIWDYSQVDTLKTQWDDLANKVAGGAIKTKQKLGYFTHF